MKSTLVSASILAIAALASANSFAEGRDPYPLDQLDQVSAASTKTRADVQAELLQAQRAGYDANLNSGYKQVKAAPASTRTRAEVKAEASSGTAVSVSALEHAYPAVQ